MEFIQLNQLPSYIGSIWHYEMLSIDDNEIAIGNVITAIAILLFILRLARVSSKYFATILTTKYACDQRTARTVQKSIFYFINVFAVIIAMQVAHLPVSSFAFIGGSLAIAIGLGAQNVINNFISSILIAIEQPIKVGDNIEVDGKRGKVHAINARCTILETIHKSKMLLPNSLIMQKTVTNLNLEHRNLKDSMHLKIKRNPEHTVESICAMLDTSIGKVPQYQPIDYFIETVSDTDIALIIQFSYTQQGEYSLLQAKHDLIMAIETSMQNVSYQVS